MEKVQMDLYQKLKEYEGTKQYQTKLGYYRDGKFHIYKDHLGNETIGYGHLVLSTEKQIFKNGISEVEADLLLHADIQRAKQDVKKLNISIPVASRWNDFLVMMIFQLGLTKTLGFKKFLNALNAGNYATAIIEVKDSLWYRQTAGRVDDMIAYVVRG
ncbi:glycoside hydrolase family protein [Pectobacterium brasiliense]|uniref:glycoside hydrolase family protein n=1 Tax=Pectobacterium brasiliense TaxID=180957 RepID=UPI003019C850